MGVDRADQGQRLGHRAGSLSFKSTNVRRIARHSSGEHRVATRFPSLIESIAFTQPTMTRQNERLPPQGGRPLPMN